MKIKLLGVRGSLATPLGNQEYRNKLNRILKLAIESKLNKETQIKGFINNLPENLQYNYGGNTTCVTITSNSGKIYRSVSPSKRETISAELVSVAGDPSWLTAKRNLPRPVRISSKPSPSISKA